MRTMKTIPTLTLIASLAAGITLMAGNAVARNHHDNNDSIHNDHIVSDSGEHKHHKDKDKDDGKGKEGKGTEGKKPKPGPLPNTVTIRSGSLQFSIQNRQGLIITRNPSGGLTISNGDHTHDVNVPRSGLVLSGDSINYLGRSNLTVGDGLQVNRANDGTFGVYPK